jgi:hypothetical protein
MYYYCTLFLNGTLTLVMGSPILYDTAQNIRHRDQASRFDRCVTPIRGKEHQRPELDQDQSYITAPCRLVSALNLNYWGFLEFTASSGGFRPAFKCLYNGSAVRHQNYRWLVTALSISRYRGQNPTSGAIAMTFASPPSIPIPRES